MFALTVTALISLKMPCVKHRRRKWSGIIPRAADEAAQGIPEQGTVLSDRLPIEDRPKWWSLGQFRLLYSLGFTGAYKGE